MALPYKTTLQKLFKTVCEPFKMIQLRQNRLFCLFMFLLFITVGGCQAPPDPTPPAATPLPETAVVFTIDPAASQASYLIEEEFLADAETVLGRKIAEQFATTTGTTREIQGEIVLDEQNGAITILPSTITVDLRSLQTERPERDRMLRNNWLESNLYPTAEFAITSVEELPADYQQGAPTSFQLNGNLTIREVTRPVRFAVTATYEGDTLTATAESQLRMTDFGFNPPNLAGAVIVQDEFTLFIEVTARALRYN